jgi:hypothetical protein
MKDAVLAFAEPLDKCRIVVTSREYAYLKSDEWRLPPDRFPDVTLDAFNDDQIEGFTRTWYRVVGPEKGVERSGNDAAGGPSHRRGEIPAPFEGTGPISVAADPDGPGPQQHRLSA